MRQVYSKFIPFEKIDYSSEFKDMSRFEKTYDFKLAEFEEVFPDHIAGVDPELLEEFNRIVKLCKDNGIQLVLYTAPEVTEYRSLQTDIEKVKTVFRNVPDVPYLDYSEGGEFYKKDYELWMKDSHHLNENVRFCKILIKDIKAKLNN
jgi:ketol-acid reductoisomerase